MIVLDYNQIKLKSDRIFTTLKKVDVEAWVWLAGLVLLAAIEPNAHTHFTICPFKFIGIECCPGCGLGRSVSFLFHGNIPASVHSNILGIPAVVILGARSINLIRKSGSNIPKMLNS
jgi:hypothetical protein